MHRRQSVMGLALLTALLFWVGQVLVGQVGLLAALLVVELLTFGAYWGLDTVQG
jgi:hypothetical protein